MAHRSPAYPSILFNALWFIQAISSTIIIIFFYVTWANVNNSPELRTDFGYVEHSKVVKEWYAPWFFKLLHLTAHFSLLVAAITYTLYRFGRLYPPVSCFLNFACLMLYIAGVAGVAAFSFALHLLGRCTVGSACTTYKIAFFTAHLAGATSMAQMILDGYAWGRRSLLAHEYKYIGKDENTAYEPRRGEGKE